MRLERVFVWGLPVGAVLLIACGSASPVTPEPPVTTNLVTITPTGVSPKNIIVTRGSQVTFVNDDTRVHDMQSDPHPEHNDCPEIAQVGFLVPGQRRQTGNLNLARTCGYHDNQNEGMASLRGTIVIQ